MARWVLLALAALVSVAAAVNVTIHGKLGRGIHVDVQRLLSGRGAHYSARKYGVVRADLDQTMIDRIRSHPAVRSVRPLLPPDVRSTTDAAVAAMGVSTLRATYGATGSGIKIGVISDSASPSSVAAAKASGDLPATGVTVLNAGSGTDEGTAIMTLLHAMAPAAQLYFYQCGVQETDMATAIAALASAGCDIILDDIGWSDEPPLHEYSPIMAEIRTYLAAGGLYLSAAGNDGNLAQGTSTTWEGPWVPATGTNREWASFGSPSVAALTLEGPYTPEGITLWWSDPLGGSCNDYDLYLKDQRGDVIAASENPQTCTQDPVEMIFSIPTLNFGVNTYTIHVANYSAAAARYLRVQLFGCGDVCAVTPATSGNTYGHATTALGIAAVDVSECSPTCYGQTLTAESFSSDGPRRVFFGPDGVTPLVANLDGTGVALAQPSFAGLDGSNSAVSGFAPFFGTSAATPHVAALLALILGAAPGISAADATALLNATTIAVPGGGSGVPWLAPVFAALAACGSGHYLVAATLACVACPEGGTGTVGVGTCVAPTPTPTGAPRGAGGSGVGAVAPVASFVTGMALAVAACIVQ